MLRKYIAEYSRIFPPTDSHILVSLVRTFAWLQILIINIKSDLRLSVPNILNNLQCLEYTLLDLKEDIKL